MAAAHTPEVNARPARRSTVPAAPKLRDSCDACAASKVKCNKEKPTCARCAKRGAVCEYFVTKRVGRNHNARPTTSTTVTQTSSSTPSEVGIVTPNNLIQPSPGPQTIGYPDLSPNILSPGDPTSWWALTTLGTEMDDFFTSSESFPAPETSDSDNPGQSLFYPRGGSGSGSGSSKSDFGSNDAGTHILDDAFLVMDNAALEPTDPSKQASLPDTRSSITNDAQNFQGFFSDSPCCCLIRALGLLKQLFRSTLTACTCVEKQGYKHTTCQLPTIQSVIAENEQTIEAISSMLQCPCSQDGYLLTIMSLTVFKTLGWYAAAARETPEAPVSDDGQSSNKSSLSRHPSCHPEQVLQFPVIMGSYHVDGEDQGRMAAQLVLSELYRVQRLVNQLSKRLKAADGQGIGCNGDNTSPFSATMLGQLEADLRKRLRALSLEIVEMLRRG